MKVKVKDCRDKKPTASLLFTVKGVVGHILLNMVDGVIVYPNENIISVLHDNKFDDIAVDDIIYVNVNTIFLMSSCAEIQYYRQLGCHKLLSVVVC